MKRRTLLIFAALLVGVVAPPFTIGGFGNPNFPLQIFTAGTLAGDCATCATQVCENTVHRSRALSLPMLCHSLGIGNGLFHKGGGVAYIAAV